MKEVESELGGMRHDWADRSERADIAKRAVG